MEEKYVKNKATTSERTYQHTSQTRLATRYCSVPAVQACAVKTHHALGQQEKSMYIPFRLHSRSEESVNAARRVPPNRFQKRYGLFGAVTAFTSNTEH
jgi:hypothetical protein